MVQPSHPFQVAELLGITPHYVIKKRRELGIKGFDRFKQWTQEEIDLLGTMHDNELAELLDISTLIVRNKRHKLGIKEFARGRKWTQEEIDLLGTMSDRELAELLGINENIVYGKRKKEKIAPKKKGREWTQEEIDLLGTMYDYELAELLGVTRTTIMKKRIQYQKKSYHQVQKALRKQEKLKRLIEQKQSRTVDTRLNPNLLQGQEFRTKEDVILKGKDSIPSDAGHLPRYDSSGKRRLSPGRRDRGGKK